MARRARSLRPTLSTTTGLPRSAARSRAATNRSGCRTVSRNIAITRVAGSSTRYSSTSAATITASLPVEITRLQPNRRQSARSPMTIDPLWEISPTLPASGAGSRRAFRYTRLRSCGLITPMQFGPQNAIPASRQMATSSSCRRRPASSLSANPASNATAARIPFRAAGRSPSSTRSWLTQNASTSTPAGRSSTDR
jgi:hypothetical protein